jgi:hypothetical protein
MRFDAQPPRPLSENKEFLAPAQLTNRFLCFWTQTIVGSRGIYEHRVLPDACIDIVLIRDESPMVVGPWDVPFVARLAVGTSITGARCILVARPACSAFLHRSCSTSQFQLRLSRAPCKTCGLRK